METNESVKSNSHTNTRDFLVGSDKEWYHGELTRDEAEQALKASGCDCFLICHCQGDYFLSFTYRGHIYHMKIEHGLGWFKLSGESKRFNKLQELVGHYNSHLIREDLLFVLETACEKKGAVVISSFSKGFRNLA